MYVSDYIYYLFIMFLNYVGRLLEKKRPHLYMHARDLFGNEFSIRIRKTKPPG